MQQRILGPQAFYMNMTVSQIDENSWQNTIMESGCMGAQSSS
jgi:hypothetical protein